MEKITAEYQTTLHQDGLIKIWLWKDGGDLNIQYQCKVPIWEMLPSNDLYKLLTEQTVEIQQSVLDRCCEVIEH